ncbi:MAG: hypothetical protein AAFX99_05520, partial [Myxococcota bacterium]
MQTGRWLSIDPLFAVADAYNIMNIGNATTAYNYVAGNIANDYDPTGLKPGGGDGKASKFKS